MEKAVAPALSCWEPARVSPASLMPLLFASTHTRTRALASAVPRITEVLALRVTADVGVVTVGAAGAVTSTVKTESVTKFVAFLYSLSCHVPSLPAPKLGKDALSYFDCQFHWSVPV